jgi:uncharacterized protein YyaL (SSP411 family)
MQIHWLEWSPEAFARAESEKRPILLSLVTAWSDECVVMDRTTYADADVVSIVDRQFVPVRVDGDRHPDVNERYNLGGWPTTAFLTSTGAILSGSTYLSAAQMIAMLPKVADAYQTVRREEVPDRDPHPPGRDPGPPDLAIAHFRSLLIDRFDPVHGGFGNAPKLPHPYALLFALSFPDDPDLSHLVSITVDRLTALWDPIDGGFYRYADAADWSHPGTEKTLEDNAALLHVYVEAAISGHDGSRDRAAAIVRWVKGAMADQANGGFYNAQASRGVDDSMYVDRNAMMVGAFIRAAALFDDIWLRDFALKSLEAIAVPTYVPGDGVGHAADSVRGLLTDQIHVSSALIWAHAATGQLPYSMLAAELMQFAIRRMWTDEADKFRDRVSPDDPVMPFDLNCHAAYVLGRLAVLTGDDQYRTRAGRLLDALSAEYRQQDLFGALYALAVREVIDGRPPAGLELARVDWHLG